MSLLNFVSIGCYLLLGAIFFLDNVTPPEMAVPVLYVAAVLLSLWHPRAYFTYGIAILGTLLTVLSWLIDHNAGSDWKVGLANDSIAIAATWTTTLVTIERKKIATQRLEALRERDKAKEEVKALTSLLPVCAWCKKVRDDKGYWDGIESYLARSTQSALTHGMCPECSDKMAAEVEAL